jgi:hypothetical protein
MVDRCIRHLLLDNPKSICQLARNGLVYADQLYLGWDREAMQESQVGQYLVEFMVVSEESKESKEMEEKYRMMASKSQIE